MEQLLEGFLDTLFPRHKSAQELEVLSAPELREKLRPVLTPPEGVVSLFSYTDSRVRDLIWEIKYKKNKRLAFMCAELLAEPLLDFVYEKKDFYPSSKFLLLPVPTSTKRLRKRGYNQTELIASYLPKMIPNLCYCNKTLRRTKDTVSQTKRSRSERLTGVQGCFSVFNGNHIKNNVVILLDDVTTTGATLAELKKEISKFEPKEVLCVTVAH